MTLIDADRMYIMDLAASRQLDAQATSHYGIPGIVLMENAARGATEVALQMLGSRTRVHVVCGPGNNGGDGWAMARHLHNAGCDVTLTPIGMPREGSDAAANAATVHRMSIDIIPWTDANDVDLVVDALLGTGLDREVEGVIRELIESINSTEAQVLAIDLPSGLDADTGCPLGLAVRADATATFAGWKLGFMEQESVRWTGEIHTVDIGVPCELAQSLGSPLLRAERHGRGTSE
jgi:NAD(P)H-hydrate epimerase